MKSPRFASIVLDVDSTLCGIEGVDWLAERKDPAMAAEFSALTAAAMAGEIPLESIYAKRMDRIRPGAEDLAALATAYQQAVAPGAPDVLRKLRAAHVELRLVSGGLRRAILPVAADLGFAESELHAVDVMIDVAGQYQDFDRTSPLCTATGKRIVVQRLALQAPMLAVGDGISDAALLGVSDAFAAFTGFVRREPVVALATHECRSFNDLLHLVLS